MNTSRICEHCDARWTDIGVHPYEPIANRCPNCGGFCKDELRQAVKDAVAKMKNLTRVEYTDSFMRQELRPLIERLNKLGEE